MHTVAVVGLGYVGLPLAIEFGKKQKTIGFDLNPTKIENYKRHCDPTGEVAQEEFGAAPKLEMTADPRQLAVADCIIIAVPTPIDQAHQPDFRPLAGASRAVGQNMKKGVVVIYESTVYPGATEEICVPILEQYSGMKWKRDFHIGYSPERINPGDKEHSLTKIAKVVSADDAATLETVAQLYASIVNAGVHRTSSIEVAEAAKVIENTQRDLNIALMNELAIIFDRIGIPTREVLEAAATKWNFLPFTPGLVGGHCIGVDPYYLTARAEAAGYYPQVILSGRRINDGMGSFIAQRLAKLLIAAERPVKGARIGIVGITFKENVPDLRNSRVPDIVAELREFGIAASVADPLADPGEAKREYGIDLVPLEALTELDGLILAVPHKVLGEAGWGSLFTTLSPGGVFIDVKSALARDEVPRNIHYWSL